MKSHNAAIRSSIYINLKGSAGTQDIFRSYMDRNDLDALKFKDDLSPGSSCNFDSTTSDLRFF
jgi:hypothetical protein